MDGGSNGENAHEGASNIDGSAKTIEIKIKTLDSQVYTCRVEQNISVPALKEHIATLTSVPAENQRLICRGKVLKDDQILSSYNVEDGHTLHLVTRQVPQPGASAPSGESSRNAGVGEEQGGGLSDSIPGVSRSRPGQVSHSVVLGTFNIPDHGDGGIPDVSRIITSVLSSLGIANLVPPNAGANNGGFAGGAPSMDTPEIAAAGLAGRPQAGGDAGNPSQPSELAGTQELDPQRNTVHSSHTSPGTAGTMPAMGQQIRLVQQVIPDALTTMSQYLDRLEQVFTTDGNQQVQAALLAAPPPNSGPGTGPQAPLRGYPVPANLAAIIRRTLGLLNGQAGVELARLASQLENEMNLADVTARGELQSSALRDGILMQHLGALLLELGRSTLTVRMGSSPVESAVNAGPAVFISPAGPNPMMVQPLPFQPGVGIGTLTGGAQQSVGVAGASLSRNEVPRNINIHIHTSDSGLPSGVPLHPQFPLPAQGGVPSNSGVSIPIASSGSTTVALDRPTSGTSVPLVQNIPVSLQGSEQGGVRVLPMRTLVAAMPSPLNRPAGDTAGAPLGAFYPLLARFQQLNSAQFSQQVTGVQAASSNGVPPGFPVMQPGTTQQISNSVSPTIRAQVQVQAWVPSAGPTMEGQGGARTTINEGTHIPVASSTHSQQQQAPNDGADVVMNSQTQLSQSIAATSSVDTDADAQQLVPSDPAAQAGGSGMTASEHVQEHEIEACIQEEQANAIITSDNIKASATGKINTKEVSDSGRTDVGHRVADVPTGLGLGGLQPLPSRTHKRSHRQHHRHQADHAAPDESSLHQDLAAASMPSSAPRSEAMDAIGTGSGQIPSGITQLLSGTRINGTGGGGNVDIGNLISQVMGNAGSRNSLAGVRTRDAEEGLGLPTGTLGNVMGQVMQSPFMRNVLQQVVEQVGEQPQGLEDMISQGMSGQGGLNFSGMLQQMMPIVSQALGRVSSTSSEQASGISHGVSMRTMENGGAFGSTEQVIEVTHGLEDTQSLGLNAHGNSNLSAMLQQMLPVVAQVFGGAVGVGSEQASGLPHDRVLGVVTGADPVSEPQRHGANQDDGPQCSEPRSSGVEQETTETQEPASDMHSGGAPVPKRQKIDLERAVQKLEQDSSSPEEFVRVIAETATTLIALNGNPEADARHLADHLSQDDGLVNEYMALLLRDLTSRVSGEP